MLLIQLQSKSNSTIIKQHNPLFSFYASGLWVQKKNKNWELKLAGSSSSIECTCVLHFPPSPSTFSMAKSVGSFRSLDTIDSNASLYKQPIATRSTTGGRPKFRLWRHGRKLPIVRLGGTKPRRGFFLARFFRGFRLRWLKLQYCCILRRLKQYYRSLIKDLIEASASVEAYQQRVLMETSLAVPVMGVSFNNYHGGRSLRGPGSIFM
ncbi:hypothetical protein Cgig2_025186 [Carnegiea gigantea]|uniref:Uncharacterized protein n=1 Tax=Carnegiea gigantea TaxID=171969 RepID=A0A9Q1KTB5_9CARY|nr:hypothetical protein Cgig2_025186 [Carnegiea gigantea]